jgi:hypothetical protein
MPAATRLTWRVLVWLALRMRCPARIAEFRRCPAQTWNDVIWVALSSAADQAGSSVGGGGAGASFWEADEQQCHYSLQDKHFHCLHIMSSGSRWIRR